MPNLRRAQLSFGLAWTGDWTVTVAVGILAFRDGGVAAVGLVGMARMVPAALLAPLAAVLADRHRRERVLVGVGLVRSAALGGAALAVGAFAWPLLAYVLVAVASVAHTLYRPAHSALLPSVCTTTKELTGANGVRGLLDSLSALLGPLLAGLLVGPIGVDGVFAVSTGTALGSAWLIWRVAYEVPTRVAEVVQTNPAREAIEGIAFIAHEGNVGLLTLLDQPDVHPWPDTHDARAFVVAADQGDARRDDARRATPALRCRRRVRRRRSSHPCDGHAEAAGKRFLALADGPTISFLEMAQILRERLGPLAEQAPTEEAPGPEPPRLIIHNDRAKRELGWRPRSETTIVQTAESLRDLGLLENNHDKERQRNRNRPDHRPDQAGATQPRIYSPRKRCGLSGRWSPTPECRSSTPGGRVGRRLRDDLRRRPPRPRAARRRPARLVHRTGTHRAARLGPIPQQLGPANPPRPRSGLA